MTDDELQNHAVALLKLKDKEQQAVADYDALVGYYQSGAWKTDGLPVEDFAHAFKEFGERADELSLDRQMSELTFEQALGERPAHALSRSALLARARQQHHRERESVPSALDAWRQDRNVGSSVEPRRPLRKRARDRDR